MRTTANNRRILAIAQTGFKKELIAEFKPVVERIQGVILLYENSDGLVDRNQINNMQARAGAILDSFFVGADGRSPYGADGTMPLAPYPRILNKWLAMVQAMMVVAEYKWMRKNIPQEIQDYLTRTPSREVPIKEITELTDEQIEALRLFRPNPLAEYEPAHTWVDPRGYRLSDRIWRVDIETRSKLDLLLANSINEGMSARNLAKLAEQFLIPGRAKIRTKKPYGTDGSFDAMRLARTEIARAGNQAAFISAYTNPYVDKIEVRRSPNGDPTCPICPQHATIGMGGERLRPPYDILSANIPPYHPHDMCTTYGTVTDSPETVTNNLRAIIDEAGEGLPPPVTTALKPQNMLQQLLRESMYREVMEFLAQALAG